jgi:protein-disulfide isomerase
MERMKATGGIALAAALATVLAGAAFAAPQDEAAALTRALAGLNPPVTGPAGAAVTVYEVGNYTCPFCKETHPVLQRILKEYAGKIRFAYFPYVRQYDNDSMNASLAAYAAKEQGKFWELHDMLFESAPDLSMEKILALAARAGADRGKIEASVLAKKHLPELQKGLEALHALDIWSTPTIVIGDKVLKGSRPYEEYKAALDAALAAKRSSLGDALRSLAARIGEYLLPSARAAEAGAACRLAPGMFGPIGAPLYVKVEPGRPVNALAVGDKAPAFSLPSTGGETVSLSDFAGKKNLLIAFLPAAFTPV